MRPSVFREIDADRAAIAECFPFELPGFLVMDADRELRAGGHPERGAGSRLRILAGQPVGEDMFRDCRRA